MMKKYKIKIGTKTYSTHRKSSFILGLLCKFILTRRRVKRFIKRNTKENKIIFYMFFALIIIYSLFFLINIKKIVNIIKFIKITLPSYGKKKIYLLNQ